MDSNVRHQNIQRLYWVKENVFANDFPQVDMALTTPDGLLAIGGDLSSQRILKAYQAGIFPWYSEGQPILWWSPDPRCILELDKFKLSRSLAKRIRQNRFSITFNKAFEVVLDCCAAPRHSISDTWITQNVKLAYLNLFHLGYAHSVECWQEEKLVGGLYGLALGQVFFGESMFSKATDASKIALARLVEKLRARKFHFIDCQVHSNHLQSLGATCVPRKKFKQMLNIHCSLNKLINLKD